MYSRFINFLLTLLWKLVRFLEAERAYQVLLFLTRFFPSAPPDPPALHTKVWNIDFPNPIGLAAGFDKQGRAVSALSRLGFGFIELGSVTLRPNAGHTPPRLFFLHDQQSIINHFGFNSIGIDRLRDNLCYRSSKPSDQVVLGINLGKSKTGALSDFIQGLAQIHPYADYLVINISSPNTAGLTALQQGQYFQLLADSLPIVNKPVLFKLSPDLTAEERVVIARIALTHDVAGLIISNTTATVSGGLSGRPLFYSSTQGLAEFYRLTRGSIPLIASGGVFSGADAYQKIRNGASLVQVLTAFVFHGPMLIARIKRELAQLLTRDNFPNVQAAVGVDVPIS